MGGLMDYKARFYSPYINHFTQPDTIVPDPANPQAWNRYSYALNNPIRYNDPTGHKIDEGCGSGEGCTLPKPKPKLTPRPHPSTRPVTKRQHYMYTSFQMFQVTDPYYYAQSAEEGYTDFPGGGDPKYFPQVRGIRNRQESRSGPWDVVGLFNDFLLGIQYPVLKEITPYNQTVILGYQTTYSNIPKIDSDKTVTLTSLQIRNSSNIQSAINYTIIMSGNGIQAVSKAVAGPGQTAAIHIPTNLQVNNNIGSIQLNVIAFTGCTGPCIYSESSLDLRGFTNFTFNP